jgi:hypothetical protein
MVRYFELSANFFLLSSGDFLICSTRRTTKDIQREGERRNLDFHESFWAVRAVRRAFQMLLGKTEEVILLRSMVVINFYPTSPIANMSYSREAAADPRATLHS